MLPWPVVTSLPRLILLWGKFWLPSLAFWFETCIIYHSASCCQKVIQGMRLCGLQFWSCWLDFLSGWFDAGMSLFYDSPSFFENNILLLPRFVDSWGLLTLYLQKVWQPLSIYQPLDMLPIMKTMWRLVCINFHPAFQGMPEATTIFSVFDFLVLFVVGSRRWFRVQSRTFNGPCMNGFSDHNLILFCCCTIWHPCKSIGGFTFGLALASETCWFEEQIRFRHTMNPTLFSWFSKSLDILFEGRFSHSLHKWTPMSLLLKYLHSFNIVCCFAFCYVIWTWKYGWLKIIHFYYPLDMHYFILINYTQFLNFKRSLKWSINTNYYTKSY